MWSRGGKVTLMGNFNLILLLIKRRLFTLCVPVTMYPSPCPLLLIQVHRLLVEMQCYKFSLYLRPQPFFSSSNKRDKVSVKCYIVSRGVEIKFKEEIKFPREI